MDQRRTSLFAEQEAELAKAGTAPVKRVAQGIARVLRPNRSQLELRPSDLESLLPEGHRARAVWAYVEQADVSRLYADIKAVDGGSGRTPIAPEILLALWLYATVEGVGSARAIARLTQEHDAYRWICGGIQVNYHTVSDFQAEHGAALDGLLTDSVAALLAVGAVKLKRVAQDGMRVRASAGAASFRRRGTLERCLEDARQQVEALKQQVEDDPGALTRKRQAARARAARERDEKVRKALERLPELEQIKAKQGRKADEARASTSDAEATVMKMGDGGFRPAYNAQLATDTETQRSRQRPARGETRRQRSGCRVAGTDGPGRRPADLSRACCHGRVRQRLGAEPGTAPVARAGVVCHIISPVISQGDPGRIGLSFSR